MIWAMQDITENFGSVLASVLASLFRRLIVRWRLVAQSRWHPEYTPKFAEYLEAAIATVSADANL